jgi:hypothetical protein
MKERLVVVDSRGFGYPHFSHLTLLASFIYPPDVITTLSGRHHERPS